MSNALKAIFNFLRRGRRCPIYPLSLENHYHVFDAYTRLYDGDLAQANKELEQIPAELQGHPEVLKVRFWIHHKAENWEGCLAAAEAVLSVDPRRSTQLQHRSFALHKLGRTQEAYDKLKHAVKIYNGNWEMHYDMARYACKLGRRREAWNFLKRAIELRETNAVKRLALKEPDLEPLWADIRGA